MLKNLGRSAAVLALVGGVACVPQASVRTQVPPPAAPGGTYRVSICSGACAADESNLLVAGILVLTPQPFALDRLSEAAQRHLRERDPWLLVALWEFGREPNACFALETRPGASTLAGTSRARITDWRSSERGITVSLWVSPDAGYAAELRPDGPDLRGDGFTWGMGGGYQQTTETIFAAYIGPPDLDRCLQAIEAEAARRR